jgi:stress response protein YsnF
MMAERPVDSKTDMNVQLSNEEIEVIKEPYVKEEDMMKKTLDTETRDVEDSAASEKFDASTIKEG